MQDENLKVRMNIHMCMIEINDKNDYKNDERVHFIFIRFIFVSINQRFYFNEISFHFHRIWDPYDAFFGTCLLCFYCLEK